MQCSPDKPLAGVAALAPACMLLVVFRKGRGHQEQLGGGGILLGPDPGPIIVSRLQFPKGSSCSASCTQSQHLWGAMTRYPETRPDHLNAGFDCQSDRQTYRAVDGQDFALLSVYVASYLCDL